MKFINIAISEAEKSSLGIRHGCVITKGGKEMSRGYNSKRSIMWGEIIPSVHAERSAVCASKRNKYKQRVHGATIYIVRIKMDKNGNINLSNSKPCTDCARYLKKLNIKKIVYSIDGGIVVVKTKNLNDTRISYGYKTFSGKYIHGKKCKHKLFFFKN